MLLFLNDAKMGVNLLAERSHVGSSHPKTNLVIFRPILQILE